VVRLLIFRCALSPTGAIGEHLDAFKATPLRAARNQTKA
jgi:hypothetical protein